MEGLAIIMGFWLLGEGIVALLGAPFPGTVLGLVLLWFALEQGWVGLDSIQRTAHCLLENLTFFFTPIVVGVVVYVEVFAQYWLAIGVSLLMSTALGLIATGKVAQWLGGANTKDAKLQ